MWDSIVSPGGIVGAIGVIATGIALALLGTVRTLRESLGDLRSRVDDLEKEREDLKDRVSERDKTIETARRDLDTLTRVVTGEAHWVALEQLLHDVVDRLKGIVGQLDTLLRKGP